MTHRKRLRPALLALAALPLASPALADSGGYVTIKSGKIESSILQSVAANLPESRAVGAAFLNPAYDPNLRISETAHVSASFISEGAGFRNSLGYFTFSESTFANLNRGAIDSNRDGVVSLRELGTLSGVTTGWLFQNASAAGSGGSLKAGDTVTLNGGNPFAAGTRVGFFLVQDGWTGSGVTSGAYNGNANVFYTVDMLNPENAQTATASGYDVSPYARHVAMMYADESQSKIILGFEDLVRARPGSAVPSGTSDEDFNDAVFVLESDPVKALAQTPIYTAPVRLAGGPLALMLVAGAGFWVRRRPRRSAPRA